MITSKLHYIAYFYTFLIISFPAICLYFINKISQFVKGEWSWGVIVFVAFLGLVALAVFVWGFFVEMNLRMARVTVSDKTVQIKQLLGWGTQREWPFEAIDGFVLKKFRTRTQEQEYLYLIQDKKAIGVFSSLYFKNYAEIKEVLSTRLKEYGA